MFDSVHVVIFSCIQNNFHSYCIWLKNNKGIILYRQNVNLLPIYSSFISPSYIDFKNHSNYEDCFMLSILKSNHFLTIESFGRLFVYLFWNFLLKALVNPYKIETIFANDVPVTNRKPSTWKCCFLYS